MLVVTLDAAELEFAAYVGARRQAGAIVAGLVHTASATGHMDGDDWGRHINGAAAEMAVAKALQRYWYPALRPQPKTAGDVGPYQVRSTAREDNPLLVIRPGDDPAAYFILAAGKAPRFTVYGYLQAGEARRDEWKAAPNGRPAAWFVPAPFLHPLGGRA